MFLTFSQRFTDKYNFQDDDITEKCKVIIAFEHPSAGFGFELEDSKIHLVTARWPENACACSREEKQKGCTYHLSDAPLNWGRSCQKGVNKLKTNKLLLLPLHPPHKDGQQILVSRFSKGCLKLLEGTQRKRSPRGCPRGQLDSLPAGSSTTLSHAATKPIN